MPPDIEHKRSSLKKGFRIILSENHTLIDINMSVSFIMNECDIENILILKVINTRDQARTMAHEINSQNARARVRTRTH